MRSFCPSPTARVRFRLWTPADRSALRRLNRDRQVMEFFPSILSARASDALLDRLMRHQEENGFTAWPVLAGNADEKAFAGFVGLLRVGFDAPFAPAVEIGWRLLPEFWGRGLAAEAAGASLDFAFNVLGLEEIVAFTTVRNRRSIRLMRRLGMRRDAAGDFDHPSLPEAHPLRRHVLYRLSSEEFRRQGEHEDGARRDAAEEPFVRTP